jgi:hypothetical protein
MTKATSNRFDLSEVELSSNVTVQRYREMESTKDRRGLAKFIKERLLERYVDPLQTAKKKHGFLIMAAACLLIETLESFYRGWPDTNEGKASADIDDPCKPADPNRTTVSAGEVAFCYFFQREPAFALFRPYASEFYKCVRCGILHQGETTGGWRIRREGDDLFDAPSLTINANKFLAVVERSIGAYAEELRRPEADWNDEIWENFQVKMNAIIDHCKR